MANGLFAIAVICILLSNAIYSFAYANIRPRLLLFIFRFCDAFTSNYVRLGFLFSLILLCVLFMCNPKATRIQVIFFFRVKRFCGESLKTYIYIYILKWSEKRGKRKSSRLAILSLHCHSIDFRWQLYSRTLFPSLVVMARRESLNIERVHKSFNYVNRDCCTAR